jgi:hypothetical protein
MGLALILVVMTLAVLMDSMVEDLTVSRKCSDFISCTSVNC